MEKIIPVVEDHCSAGGVILLKEVGNCPKHVSRAEQLKWNHGATGHGTITGVKTKTGPFTAGNLLAEEGLTTGSWWRGSAPTRIPKDKDRNEVRWPAADIKNMQGEKTKQNKKRAGKHHLCGSHLAKDVPEAKSFIPGSCHDGLAIRRHGLHGGLTVSHWSYNNQMLWQRWNGRKFLPYIY